MRKNLIFSLVLSFVFYFISQSTAFASITTPNYYNTVSEIPASLGEACPIPCNTTDNGNTITDQCWNGSTPGVKISCGDACVTQGAGGTVPNRSWTWYYNEKTQGNRCRHDKDLSIALGETVCTPIYIVNGASCSTADKYNISSYGGGDTTMLRSGSCTCSARALYKTCCNGANAVQTYQAGGNPSFPDGGCSATTTPCGPDRSIYDELGYEFKNVSCGQPACQAFFGTPAPTPTPNPLCPGSGVPSSGWGGSCSPGSVQYPACGACGTCSVASCSQYAPNVYCWFNSGTCYNDPVVCPNKCGGQCITGATQTICYPNESTRTCNR